MQGSRRGLCKVRRYTGKWEVPGYRDLCGAQFREELCGAAYAVSGSIDLDTYGRSKCKKVEGHPSRRLGHRL